MGALGNKMILDISKNNRDLIERLKSSGILGFKSLDNKTQVFITTTDLKSINKRIISRAKIFDLDERMCK